MTKTEHPFLFFFWLLQLILKCEEKLKVFFDYLNNAHDTIKFTSKWSKWDNNNNNNNLLIGCSITRVVYIEVLLLDVYYMMQLKYKKN